VDSVANAVAVSPHGVLAVGAETGEVQTWDLESRELLRTLRQHNKPVNQVVFSDDGHLLASQAGDKEVHLWEIDTGTLQHTLRGNTHFSGLPTIAFTDDGQRLATADGNNVRVWDSDSGTQVDLFTDEDDVRALAYSKCAETLAVHTAGTIPIVRLWDCRNGTPVRTLRGQLPIFWPDENTLLIASYDDCQMWDLATGDRRCMLTQSMSKRNLKFSADGRVAANLEYGEASLIRFWKVPSEADVQNAGW
jgi:WD40 repeat protein